MPYFGPGFGGGGGTVVVPQPSSPLNIAYPPLTGDVMQDTLNSLLALRLGVVRAGPTVTFNVHGHFYDFNGYLAVLDQQIMQVRQELAMSEPVEIIGVGM